MLKIFTSFSTLPMNEVLEIYTEYCEMTWDSPKIQAFYSYLKDDFFAEHGIFALWEEDNTYKSAVRLVPWENGMLLTGLETTVPERNCGYGKKLLLSVVEYAAENQVSVLYSHIKKSNAASIAVHKACGFQTLAGNARLLDGSVVSDHYTLYLNL